MPTNGAAYAMGSDIKMARFYKGTTHSNMNDFHAKGATPPKPFRFAIIPFFKESTFSR
ncbi:hypothetical protein KUIN1_24600 [Pseudomonas sp. KUIN-1]|nr:hypothetical protein KUIN1_24600 [Pseudomonas sp. KUIN-1]